MKTTVTARGQVSIPAPIRKRFDITPEVQIEWIVENDIIMLIPVPNDPIAAFKGRGKGKYSTKKFIQERKKERALENKKDKKKK